MGDPKKQRKKYSTPGHPWNKERIEAEKKVIRGYGIRRKNEIWKMNSILKDIQRQAKTIIGSRTSQSEIEKERLLAKIYKLGFLPKNSGIGEVLNLQLKDVLERRLQTLIVRKKLANTMLQARQFIVHYHISVNGKKISSPSYIVPISDEPQIGYAEDSGLKSIKAETNKKAETAVAGKDKNE